jgi:hypothetical protein
MGCDWWDVGCQAKEAASSISNTVNRELSNAGNAVNSAANAAVGGASAENVAINTLTGGLIGYENGQLTPGVVTRANVEGIGELTGANQARRANNLAEQALADQRAEAERLRKEQIEKMRLNDVNASRKAGQAQSNAYLTASASAGSQAYNNLTRDFLGL